MSHNISITMQLDENDYLTYQLYNASKTQRVREGRIRAWIATTAIFLGMAYLFYVSDNQALMIYFLVLSLITLVFYPLYSRWRYKKHYAKHIREVYKNRFNQACTLEISDDLIVAKDSGSETRINTSEIEVVNEIEGFYFLKLKTGTSLIIAKAKANDPAQIVEAMKSLLANKAIKHNVELNWKWQ